MKKKCGKRIKNKQIKKENIQLVLGKITEYKMRHRENIKINKEIKSKNREK